MFDWLKNLFSSKVAKEVGGAVLETAAEVAKDTASAYLDAQVGDALARMRTLIDREAKLRPASRAALNAGLDSILQAIEGARSA